MITVCKKIWVEKTKENIRFVDGMEHVLEIPLDANGNMTVPATEPILSEFFCKQLFDNVYAYEEKSLDKDSKKQYGIK